MVDESRDAYHAANGLTLAVADLIRFGMAGDSRAVEDTARALMSRPPRAVRNQEHFRSSIELAMENASRASRRLTRRFDASGVTSPVDVYEPEPRAGQLTFNGPTMQLLADIVREREAKDRLERAGLQPPSKVLMSGPPGVGKTMSAHWLATHLGTRVVVLDLARIMSSYLGESGKNIRQAFAAASEQPCVFLIDEFDALAKRRDDSSDLGELKRLVNVLLLELDGWAGDNLLVAATNHPQLLDPAVQRRFDVLINMPLPEPAEKARVMADVFGDDTPSGGLIEALSMGMIGYSNSDVVRFARSVYRAAIVSGASVEDVLIDRASGSGILDHDAEGEVWLWMSGAGMSDRAIAERVGVTHPTVGKRIKKAKVLTDGGIG